MPDRIYLREWREHLGKSLEWMAGELGVDRGTLSKHEKRAALDPSLKNKSKGVDITWAIAYQEALGLGTLDQLLRHPKEPAKTAELVAAAPPDVQEHIRGLVARISP